VSSRDEAALHDNGLGWYLYGVVAAGESTPKLDAEGIAVDPDHDVELVTEGPLAGLASRVSLDEFDEATLPERLGDAAWLEQKIRAHEQVLERALRDVSIVPCRFCTVYRNESELRRFLSDHVEPLRAALDRVHGQVEVGVKAYVDRERFVAGQSGRNERIRELQERAASLAEGRAYLERRRLEQLVSAEVDRLRSSAGRDIHARLLERAGDGLSLALQATDVSGREEEMIFHAAYLVGADASGFEAALGSLAAEYRDAGVDFELTGPWPPYNFVPAELQAP
jgi:Gas vesicle synthesis protein GvpL/GvpF